MSGSQILSPGLVDKVDSGIGLSYLPARLHIDSGTRLSYRPARLHRLAGRYDNCIPESTIAPRSGTKNLATVEVC
jgi:hypothetical protein